MQLMVIVHCKLVHVLLTWQLLVIEGPSFDSVTGQLRVIM
jgi:hypothetical protein